MILDLLEQITSGQALTATALSTNTKDLGSTTPTRDIGTGEPMTMMIAVSVAADFTTGDETYEFQVIGSANANLSSSSILHRRAILASALTLGSVHFVDIPANAITQRYIGMNFVLGGTTPLLTVSVYLVSKQFIQAFKTYAKGFTIS